MTKIVCDRCKTEMTEKDERFIVSDEKINNHSCARMPSLDLCPSCNAKLLMFLAGTDLEKPHGEQ